MDETTLIIISALHYAAFNNNSEIVILTFKENNPKILNLTARIIDSPILKRLFNFCGGQMNENSLWIKNGSKITITDRMPN